MICQVDVLLKLMISDPTMDRDVSVEFNRYSFEETYKHSKMNQKMS